MGERKTISINELLNNTENPRHDVGKNEEDTIKKLFDAVGAQQMLNLASDIAEYGLLGNQQVVVVYSDELGKYVVYEGNRRIAVIKIMLEPDRYSYLDRAFVERLKEIGEEGSVPDKIECYVTDEDEALFIMERLHSGEDKGRGIKQWNAKEKDAFSTRRGRKRKISSIINDLTRKEFDGFEITSILPFTTLERIFNNKEVKQTIGISENDIATFTKEKLQLIVMIAKHVQEEAEASGLSVTRLYNRAEMIKSTLVPWIIAYIEQHSMDPHDKEGTMGDPEEKQVVSEEKQETTPNETSKGEPHREKGRKDSKDGESIRSGVQPYFFQGLDYSHLNENDINSHGLLAICKELEAFSEKRLVEKYPIAATFLVRALIEQSLVYYSKTHCIQGQSKKIIEQVDFSKLSAAIDKYIKRLPDFISEQTIRDYFTALFKDYKENVDPMNWVIHRPAEFRLSSMDIESFPHRGGFLTVINYLIS